MGFRHRTRLNLVLFVALLMVGCGRSESELATDRQGDAPESPTVTTGLPSTDSPEQPSSPAQVDAQPLLIHSPPEPLDLVGRPPSILAYGGTFPVGFVQETSRWIQDAPCASSSSIADADLALLGTVNDVSVAQVIGEDPMTIFDVNVSVKVDATLGGRHSFSNRLGTVDIVLRIVAERSLEDQMLRDLRTGIGGQYLWFLYESIDSSAPEATPVYLVSDTLVVDSSGRFVRPPVGAARVRDINRARRAGDGHRPWLRS